MIKKSDLVTRKDLEVFGKKLEKRIEQNLEQKLEQKLDEKFDVKFGEYFNIIIKEINRIFDQKFEQIGIHFQNQHDQHKFDIGLHESSLTSIKYKLEDHDHRILNLEKRTPISAN